MVRKSDLLALFSLMGLYLLYVERFFHVEDVSSRLVEKKTRPWI